MSAESSREEGHGWGGGRKKKYTSHGIAAVCVALFIILAVLVAYILYGGFQDYDDDDDSTTTNLTRIPDKFIMACATSSYQIEGAWNSGGKGESIWDKFAHTNSNRIMDGQNGDIACDSYNLYKEDVIMVKQTGFDAYRFSMSWSRILPSGGADNVNQEGIAYYHNLIDELVANNITPLVTLYHWEMPQVLEDQGGWLNPVIADYFQNYTNVVFNEYGDKVKWWITMNEPRMIRTGYGGPLYAPGLNDHGVSDYAAAHNVLRAHAKAYRLYEKVYKPTQQGQVGIVNDAFNILPLDPHSKEDKDAARRSLMFYTGIFTNPIFSADGDYPEVVKQRVRDNSMAEGRNTSRLPEFTLQEIQDIRGSFDFYGLNHYFTYYAAYEVSGENPSFDRDSGAALYTPTRLPSGLRSVLNWIKEEYNNPPVIITENGIGLEPGDLNDLDRVRFHHDYIKELLKARYLDDCNVFGYTVWSLMDNFEWYHGYTEKYGLWHVDLQSPNKTRSMKQSAYFFQELLSSRQLPTFPFSHGTNN